MNRTLIYLPALLATALIVSHSTAQNMDSDNVYLSGVEASFNRNNWEMNRLNWVPDVRRPLLSPKEGKFRNIYAPSAVETTAGRHMIYYGAWDGSPTGNDRIYSVATSDFISFDNRRTEIEHGPFQHVCNVSATLAPDGIALMCTVYPDKAGYNKPASFFSTNGINWNGRDAPCIPVIDDIVDIDGYDRYADADINGMNVVLYDNGRYNLYFCNFRDFGKVYRAKGSSPSKFELDGVALDARLHVNDVKRLETPTGPLYLMALHKNSDTLSYALSRDGLTFESPQALFQSASADERYIVAVGFVLSNTHNKTRNAVAGILYGAGAVPTLDQNRIFARWLQKRSYFLTEDGRQIQSRGALGPNTQVFPVSRPQKGRFVVVSEDGVTTLGVTAVRTIEPGARLTIDPAIPAGEREIRFLK